MKVELHTLLTSSLDGSEISTSRAGYCVCVLACVRVYIYGKSLVDIYIYIYIYIYMGQVAQSV